MFRWMILAFFFVGSAQAEVVATNPLSDLFATNSTPLQAQFVARDETGKTIGEGVFTVGKQGRFRWNQSVPYPQLIVFNGRTAWQVDVELHQATRLPEYAVVVWTMLWQPKSKNGLVDIWRIDDHTFVFTGKQQLQGKSAGVKINSDGFPSEIKTTNTTFELRTWRRTPQATGVFEYQPPKDIDIIE